MTSELEMTMRAAAMILPSPRYADAAPLQRFDLATARLAAELLSARDAFGALFPAFSEEDRAAAADAMPALMRMVLAAADGFISELALEADAFIGGVFSAYGRKAVAAVASAGWETESFDADFACAADRIRAEAARPNEAED